MAPETFAISYHRRDASTAILEVRGDVDLYTAPELRDALRDALDAQPQRLIVDLRPVSFIDSTGLAVIFSAWRTASRREISLMIVIDSGEVRRPFEISGMVELLPIVTDWNRVLASFPPLAQA